MGAYSTMEIYYFSGTGNAARISEWLKEDAEAAGISCSLYQIRRTQEKQTINPDPKALLIIISPVHGFNFPDITLRFLSSFPEGHNKVVIMNTRAGMKIGKIVTPGLSGGAFLFSTLLMGFKGYKIKGMIPFDMPSNWISFHPALRGKAVDHIFSKNRERVSKYSSRIFSGKQCYRALYDLIQDMLILPVSLGYYLFGRFVFAKSFYASARCNNCGLCIKQCPLKAIISKQNRPYWTFRCESCMKCMNSCPRNAIETAHGLIVAVSFLTSFAISLLINPLLDYPAYSFVRFAFVSAIFLGLLKPLYFLQHYLLRYKAFDTIIRCLSLTSYGWWGRYTTHRPDGKEKC